MIWGFEFGDALILFYRRLAEKNTKILRPTLYQYIVTREEFEIYSNDLFRMMVEDNLKVKIHETYPLKDVARAHTVNDTSLVFLYLLTDILRQDLEGRKTTGKLLMRP